MISIARFYVPVVFANLLQATYPIFSSGISKFPDVHRSLADFPSRSLYFVFASDICIKPNGSGTGDDHSYKLMKNLFSPF